VQLCEGHKERGATSPVVGFRIFWEHCKVSDMAGDGLFIELLNKLANSVQQNVP
jgi:hypothetical protein